MAQPRHDVACSKSGRCIMIEFIALFFLFYLVAWSWYHSWFTQAAWLIAHSRCPKPIEYFFVHGWLSGVSRFSYLVDELCTARTIVMRIRRFDAHSPHRGTLPRLRWVDDARRNIRRTSAQRCKQKTCSKTRLYTDF